MSSEWISWLWCDAIGVPLWAWILGVIVAVVLTWLMPKDGIHPW